MNANHLVSPISLAGSGQRERWLPPLLRTWATLSRSMLKGRAVGLACTLAAKQIARDGLLRVQLGGGGSFAVQADDRYWLNYLLLEQSYETDLDHFLVRALTSADSFLDCGANLGLWSIAVARVIDAAERVVAVEAGSRTFAQLKQNWADNDRSFTILHRAVGTNSGEEISFYASLGDHASATLVAGLSPEDAVKETVTTVSLLDLIGRQRSLRVADDALIFVKLDIEGMERPVFSTIDPTTNGDIAILYEDHGGDADHVSRHVLEQGFSVAFLGDDGSVEPIRQGALDRLDELKVDPARGYNLLAFAPNGCAAERMKTRFGL